MWQADARPLPNPIKMAGLKVRPWLVMVTSRTNDLVLAQTVLEEPPIPAALWDTLVQAMQYPAAGLPHRPTEIQVPSDERWASLKPHIEEIGVQLAAPGVLQHLDMLFQNLSEHLAGKSPPSLLDMPGVTPEQVGSFYEAAANFYQQSPWKKVGYETAIQVECGKYHGGPWYAVLMGQSGLTTGLAVYEDLNALQKLWERPVSYQDNARESVATSVMFGEDVDIPWPDLQAAQRHGWKVARPDAYPWIIHKERGLAYRPPLAWELELMEACLRTIPEFVQRRPQDDPTRDEMKVQLPSGELTLVLSWVQELGPE